MCIILIILFLYSVCIYIIWLQLSSQTSGSGIKSYLSLIWNLNILFVLCKFPTVVQHFIKLENSTTNNWIQNSIQSLFNNLICYDKAESRTIWTIKNDLDRNILTTIKRYIDSLCMKDLQIFWNAKWICRTKLTWFRRFHQRLCRNKKKVSIRIHAITSIFIAALSYSNRS